jgi:hypothetical protein
VDYVVTIGEMTRSNEQNKRFWAILGDVARSKPGGRKETPEAWRDIFMNAMGYQTRFQKGLEGELFPCGFKSSKLTKKQMADLQTYIEAWGSEQGVVWSDIPGEMR